MNPPKSTPEEKTRIIGPNEKVAPATPHIPDHQLLRCIGKGGYGEVWLARNFMATPWIHSRENRQAIALVRLAHQAAFV